MKPFNLREALAGKPCVSKNGKIIYIFKDVREFGFDDDTPLVGLIIFNKNNNMLTHWSDDGKNCSSDNYHIVGMYEEPELTSEQALEKAYQEGLRVRLDDGFEYPVIGKARGGSYLLGDERNTYIMWREDFGKPEICREDTAEPSPKSNTITVTLPKPFKPKVGEKYFFIRVVGLFFGFDIDEFEFDDSEFCIHHSTAGRCFRTKSDAQAWLDAMANALDD